MGQDKMRKDETTHQEIKKERMTLRQEESRIRKDSEVDHGRRTLDEQHNNLAKVIHLSTFSSPSCLQSISFEGLKADEASGDARQIPCKLPITDSLL
ncbi:hypothetical protein ROHU_028988 [Labeo rohita]|uniref:Uncharacterized protein n=1 Tax=Labeo rohita TaxID=84645 RepID=A0A498LYE3_LABRO|nr:hypothetical protein ROHU_028988 [Labeo rohita]